MDPFGNLKEYFSVQLSEQQRFDLGADVKKTIIFEAELLALVLAFSVWRSYLPASALVCFIDNNSARDVAISGTGRNAVASSLVEFMLKLEMSLNLTPWYARVPTSSNVADEPSRGDVKVLDAKGIRAVQSDSELNDIFVVLSELADKRGSTGHREET